MVGIGARGKGSAWTAGVAGTAPPAMAVFRTMGGTRHLPVARGGRSARSARSALLTVAGIVIAAGGWLAAGGLDAGAQGTAPPPVAVDVDLSEFVIRVSPAEVPAGVPVRFVARNTGGFSHQLALSAPNARGAVLAPGESHTIQVTFGAPTSVQLFCPIGDVALLPGVSHRQRGMETGFQVTAPPPGVTVQPTPSIAPAPQIAALTAPGAEVDRVTLPEGYRERFGTFYVFDRSDNRQVRHVYGNQPALAARNGQPLPYGSILIMETWRARLGPDNQPALDAAGRYQKDELAGIFVMRKERGFGEKYGPDRTGEWEYVAYRADGAGFQTPPERSQACAQCHLVAASAQQDWLVRANIFFANPQRADGGLLSLPRTGHGPGAVLSVVLPGTLPFALAAAGPLLALGGIAAGGAARRAVCRRRLRRGAPPGTGGS